MRDYCGGGNVAKAGGSNGEFFAMPWLLFAHLFVILYEEPRLRATFGYPYEKAQRAGGGRNVNVMRSKGQLWRAVYFAVPGLWAPGQII